MVNCLSKHPLKRGVSVNTRIKTGEIHKISPVLLCLGTFLSKKPVELKRLIEIAKIQSTEASNKIEGIVTSSMP